MTTQYKKYAHFVIKISNAEPHHCTSTKNHKIWKVWNFFTVWNIEDLL